MSLIFRGVDLLLLFNIYSTHRLGQDFAHITHPAELNSKYINTTIIDLRYCNSRKKRRWNKAGDWRKDDSKRYIEIGFIMKTRKNTCIYNKENGIRGSRRHTRRVPIYKLEKVDTTYMAVRTWVKINRQNDKPQRNKKKLYYSS